MIKLTGGILLHIIRHHSASPELQAGDVIMTHEEERIWLIEKLKSENPAYRKIPVPKLEDAQKDMLRMLMNVRMPAPLSAEFIRIQDAYLRKENMLKGIVDERTLEPCSSDPRLYIWQGDITRLKVDAITNAANSGMTGCYQPLHNCIEMEVLFALQHMLLIQRPGRRRTT